MAWVAGHRTRLLRSAYLLTGDQRRGGGPRAGGGDQGGRALGPAPVGAPDGVRADRHRPRPRVVVAAPSRVPVGGRRSATAPTPRRTTPGGPLSFSRRSEALPRRQRAVVVLRYFDDLTERETAEALGVTVGTVKSQAHAALRRLRSHADLRDLVGLGGEETTR